MRADPADPALASRRLILGVGGGVAAYKAAYLARRLTEAGAEVRAVMTPAALRFLGGQTLAAITGSRVTTSLFDDDRVSPHTELARWAEAMVIAPATADLLAKIAHGLADDALTATVSAFAGPTLLAPAMHSEMWEQPSTRRNAEQLERDGRRLVGPVSGELAAGDRGMGRMAEPEDILAAAAALFDRSLAGMTVLVTAGGTREALDPVRYLGNRSSGKMGTELAREAARRGARVVLVTAAPPPSPADGLEIVPVESAAEMAEAAWARAGEIDAAVLAAAVADFRPARSADRKLDRESGPPPITLEPTPNVLAGLVERVGEGTTVVGFAAEVGGFERAVRKASSYGVDLLVANDVAAPGSGFGSDTNAVRFITPAGEVETLPVMSKRAVAAAVWSRVAALRAPCARTGDGRV